MSGFALDKTASARFRLLSTSPTLGENCRHAIFILNGFSTFSFFDSHEAIISTGNRVLSSPHPKKNVSVKE